MPMHAEEFGVERSLLKFEFDGLTCFLNNRGQPNLCSDRGTILLVKAGLVPRRTPEGFHKDELGSEEGVMRLCLWQQ